MQETERFNFWVHYGLLLGRYDGLFCFIFAHYVF